MLKPQPQVVILRILNDTRIFVHHIANSLKNLIEQCF